MLNFSNFPYLDEHILSLDIDPYKGRTQCTRLPLYAGSGRGECRLALPPFYGEAAPKSRTRDLPLMGEGTCHHTKCDLYIDPYENVKV
ncbi:unnamed protein product [Malus baccata var. baccata]